MQLAAYVREAQRYAAPDIPPLRETLAQLRADLERADAPDLVARAAWLGPRLVGSVRGRIAGELSGVDDHTLLHVINTGEMPAALSRTGATP